MYIFEAFSLTLVYYDLRAAVSAFHKKLLFYIALRYLHTVGKKMKSYEQK